MLDIAMFPYDIVASPKKTTLVFLGLASPRDGDYLAAPRVVPRSAVARASNTTTSAPSLVLKVSMELRGHFHNIDL